MADVYAALPSITGKLELEYEGELRGADAVARELIRAATGRVFDRHFAGVDLQAVTEWFEKGGEIRAAAVGEKSRKTGKSIGILRQRMCLLVGDHLQPVFDLAQEHVGRRKIVARRGIDPAAGRERTL